MSMVSAGCACWVHWGECVRSGGVFEWGEGME